jgi:hypothetical protein
MLPSDRGTRDLLPPIEADRHEVTEPAATVAGSSGLASDIPLIAVPPATHPGADLPAEQEDGPTGQATGGYPAMPIESVAPSIDAHHVSDTPGGEAEGPSLIAIPMARNFSGPEPPVIVGREGAGSPDQPQGERDVQGGHELQDGHDLQVEPDGDDTRAGVGPGSNHTGLAEIDDDNNIDVQQTAVVDQGASIMVSGYVGEVVARLRIDQDLVVDQDVDISFTRDGEGHFAVMLDQEMCIDQELDVDLEIFDVDGVLHVDVFLRGSVEVEQDTTIDMEISDGPPGGTVEVNQDIEFDQDVDIDIDVEDELEERYVVKAYVEALQQADADQDAVVDVNDWNGEIDIDVDAAQTAVVDQQTIVQVDFALVEII